VARCCHGRHLDSAAGTRYLGLWKGKLTAVVGSGRPWCGELIVSLLLPLALRPFRLQVTGVTSQRREIDVLAGC
jgi:hypothetical protein